MSFRDFNFDFAIWFENHSKPIDKRTGLTIEILNFNLTMENGECPEWLLDEFLDLIFNSEN